MYEFCFDIWYFNEIVVLFLSNMDNVDGSTVRIPIWVMQIVVLIANMSTTFGDYVLW